MKKLILIIAVCTWATLKTQAQCVAKTTTQNGKIVTETAEAYIYTRQLNQYHALSIKTIKVKNDTVTKTIFRISETSTSAIIPKFVKIVFKDGTHLEQMLQYLKKLKVDNKTFNAYSFNLPLNTTAINQLSALPISHFTLLSAAKATIVTIQANNNDMLMQQLQCIAQQ